MQHKFFTFLLFSMLLSTSYAQEHSLQFFLNTTSSVNFFDRNSDLDETVSIPFRETIAFEYGLLYRKRIKKSNFRFKIGVLNNDYKVTIRRRVSSPTSPEVSTRSAGSVDGHIVFPLGLAYYRTLKNDKAMQFGITYNLRIVDRPSMGIFVRGCNEECFMPLKEFNYLISGSLHSSVGVNYELDLWKSKNGRNTLGLNIVGVLGLQPIIQTVSTLDLADGSSKEFLVNYNGTYYGLGLIYTRASEDKFSDMFKFR